MFVAVSIVAGSKPGLEVRGRDGRVERVIAGLTPELDAGLLGLRRAGGSCPTNRAAPAQVGQTSERAAAYSSRSVATGGGLSSRGSDAARSPLSARVREVRVWSQRSWTCLYSWAAIRIVATKSQ